LSVSSRSGLLVTLPAKDDEREVRVTLEVVEIEGKDLVHLVNGHRGNYSSIVDLNAGNPVLKHEPPSSCENLRRLRKETQETLKSIHGSSRLLRSEAETVGCGWPRRDVPEFDEFCGKKRCCSPWR
jgi:hypothetical protein